MSTTYSYTADFETTNDEETNHVWSWEALEIGDTEYPYRGIDIRSFIDWARGFDKTVFFHNLKFDSSYIMSELFKNGYIHVEDKNQLREGTFTSLISDTGIYYSVTVMFSNGVKLELLDSYKLITMSVEDIAIAYNLPCRKLEIDYNAPRPVGYQPTEHEWEYQHNDVAIMSLALDILFSQGMNKITQSSNALEDLKKTKGKKKFARLFPILTEKEDSFCREGYLGGAAQVNPMYKGKEVGAGQVYDVNSEYPWAMREKMLPYGRPMWFDGEYTQDEDYPLYIQKFSCSFELKEKHLPTVQAKHVPRFKNDKFLTTSYGRIVSLILTSIDLALFKEHYDIYNIEYEGGYKFHQSDTLLREYVDKWYDVKEKATVDGNSALRSIAKDMLNKPSGKFGTKPKVASKIPYYDGKIKYKCSEPKDRKSVYVPLIAFVTAYGRDLCIRHAQKHYDRFLYMDTDSNHYLGLEPVEGLPIDDKKLGYFKCESTFSRAIFLHAKCYVEETLTTEKGKAKMIANGKKTEEDFFLNEAGQLCYNKVTVAGLPAKCHSQVTLENFAVGAVYHGKLFPKMTPNGQILVEGDFKIREN